MRIPGTNIGARRVNPFALPIAKQTKPPIESHPWFWNPRRFGEGWQAPDSFVRKLLEVDPELTVCYNKYEQTFGVWMKKPSINSPVCQGWSLLFKTPILDERVFHRLYEASQRKWGNAVTYWRSVEDDIRRTRELSDKKSTQYAVEKATEVYDYSQIKNIGKGNKFSTYHS